MLITLPMSQTSPFKKVRFNIFSNEDQTDKIQLKQATDHLPPPTEKCEASSSSSSSSSESSNQSEAGGKSFPPLNPPGPNTHPSGTFNSDQESSEDQSVSLGSTDTTESDSDFNSGQSSNSNSESSSDETYNQNQSQPIIIMDLLKLIDNQPPNRSPNRPPRSKSDSNLLNLDNSGDGVVLPTWLRPNAPGRIPIKRKRPLAPAPKPVKKIKIDIIDQIRTLDDLIGLSDKYEIKPELQYSFDMKKMKALQKPLKDLRNMIGLDHIKEQIVDQIMFLLCDLKDPDQMLHTVITGSPGCGKTSTALIMSEIYQCLGFSNGKFRAVKRSDLVGMYLGHTAQKTQQVIDSVKGGVLFIDEAYSLGNPEGRDSFSKEAIDTLNQNLSEQKNNFICIIAGYRDALEKCFFAYNPGLTRRFPFRYDIENYNCNQLQQIFLRRLSSSDWTCDSVPHEFFTKLEHFFTNQGGDMEILSQMAKIAYTRRVFGKHQGQNKHLILDDVIEGFTLFTKNSEVRNRTSDDHQNPAEGFYDRKGPTGPPK